MSDYYPDTERDTITDRLDVLVRAMDGAAILHTALVHSALLPDTHGYTVGKKYTRVWVQHWDKAYDCDDCREHNRRALYREDGLGVNDYVTCDHPKPPREGQRFVAFFVQMDNGDVWKANGWKGPTRNFVRGNIMTREGRAALTAGKVGDDGYYYAGIA